MVSTYFIKGENYKKTLWNSNDDQKKKTNTNVSGLNFSLSVCAVVEL